MTCSFNCSLRLGNGGASSPWLIRLFFFFANPIWDQASGCSGSTCIFFSGLKMDSLSHAFHYGLNWNLLHNFLDFILTPTLAEIPHRQTVKLLRGIELISFHTKMSMGNGLHPSTQMLSKWKIQIGQPTRCNISSFYNTSYKRSWSDTLPIVLINCLGLGLTWV